MELALTIDYRTARPLHRQVYEELRGAILAGRLAPGERVPSTRALARSLGVARATVTQSYDQLASEGYLEAVVGSGTSVCRELPDDLLRPVPADRARPARQPARPAVGLSRFGASLADGEPFELPTQGLPIDFRRCRPTLDAFPVRQWRRLLLRYWRAGDPVLLDYAEDARGYGPLREAVAGYLARARAVRCAPDQVIIVGGSQQAIDLVARVLVDRGDRVAIENPGYLSARSAFGAQGARLCPVPVDEAGLRIERLRQEARVKLAYVTPSHQFPTGAVLPLARRLELLAWAEESGALVVEDDYDSEFRYCGRPVPALQGLDEGEAVVYIGTFSKVLFPALRLGYLVVPPHLTSVFARAKWLADRHSPTIEQCVLADFINEGHLERHLRRMRTLYDRRRRALVRALAQQLGDRARILGENAGMHLMVRLRTRLTEAEVVARAAALGVGLTSARRYYLGPGRADEFVLGYATLGERQIQEGVRRLARALES